MDITPEYNYWIQQLKQQREEHLQKCEDDMQHQRNADRAECKELLEKLEDENIELQAKNKELKYMSDLKYKNKVADMEQKHKASLEKQRKRQVYECNSDIQNQIDLDRAECENVVKNVVQNVRAEYEDALNNANAIIKARNIRVGNKKTPKTAMKRETVADVMEVWDNTQELPRTDSATSAQSNVSRSSTPVLSRTDSATSNKSNISRSSSLNLSDILDDVIEHEEDSSGRVAHMNYGNDLAEMIANNLIMDYSVEDLREMFTYFGVSDIKGLVEHINEIYVDNSKTAEMNGIVNHNRSISKFRIFKDENRNNVRAKNKSYSCINLSLRQLHNIYDELNLGYSTIEELINNFDDDNYRNYLRNVLRSDNRISKTDLCHVLMIWFESQGMLEVSDQNYDAIRWAADNGHLEVVKLLLTDEGVRDLVQKNKTPEIAYKMLMDKYDYGFKEVFSKTAFSRLPPDVLLKHVAPKLGLKKYENMYSKY